MSQSDNEQANAFGWLTALGCGGIFSVVAIVAWIIWVSVK